MDATLKDFLNEINEIAPPVKKKTSCDWQECFDEGSGFPYYWNVSTNEVTWEMPADYKTWLETSKSTKQPKGPQKTEGLFPSALPSAPEQAKILVGTDERPHKKNSLLPPKQEKLDVKERNKVVQRRKSDSEDEKIILISSYGGDTESEDDSEENSDNILQEKSNSKLNSQSNSPKSVHSKPNSTPTSDLEDDADEITILQRIKSKTKLLKQLGGDVPSPPSKPSKFALVAGYGDSEEEEEVEPDVTNQVAHSTLFPITAPIDVNQFSEPKKLEAPEEPEDINKKAFQRKRRIGVSLMNVPRKVRANDDDEGTRKGFGFKAAGSTNVKAGAIAFVKSDTLYPTAESNGDLKKEADEDQVMLKEKLAFLSEGRDAVSPVQTMLIQLETLYAALKYGSLDSNYLKRWIKETCEELVKLEEEAAPQGWLLQWDRSQKRYYYRNKVTDECQWNYPQSVDDDAMDICTTPPHIPEDDVPKLPPTSPPTPPPPPNISECDTPTTDAVLKEEQPPLPPLPLFSEGQPLPPGVDINEQTTEAASSDMTSVLDSFYSDIAAIEKSVPVIKTKELIDTTVPDMELNLEPVKKKKKVKMATGISMKKKGVSKLVEKWKSVQKDLE